MNSSILCDIELGTYFRKKSWNFGKDILCIFVKFIKPVAKEETDFDFLLKVDPHAILLVFLSHWPPH